MTKLPEIGTIVNIQYCGKKIQIAIVGVNKEQPVACIKASIS